MKISRFLRFMFFVLVACSGNESEEQSTLTNPQVLLGYNINEPTEVYELPEDLKEVSGMAIVSPTQVLLNEDENGKLYLFDLKSASVEKEIKWGKDDDYEGTALKGNTAYVVNSKGTVFQVRNFESNEPEVQEFKNEALEDCDVEGLHYLEEKNILLIACKEGKGKEERTIYSLSIDSLSLQPLPYRVLDLNKIEEGLLTTGLDKFSVGLKKMLDPEGESGILYPSGLAAHPVTGDLYVLSARSNLLVVYGADGALKEVVELLNEFFIQPESIAFTPNGDLLIGNEGQDGKPNILKFTYDKE